MVIGEALQKWPLATPEFDRYNLKSPGNSCDEVYEGSKKSSPKNGEERKGKRKKSTLPTSNH